MKENIMEIIVLEFEEHVSLGGIYLSVHGAYSKHVDSGEILDVEIEEVYGGDGDAVDVENWQYKNQPLNLILENIVKNG